MWYVLQVKTGYDLKASSALQEKGYLIKVCQETAIIRSGGKWKSKEKLLLPGYIFIDVDYSAEHYYNIKKVPGVIRFLGNSGLTPSPLIGIEVEWVKALSGEQGKPAEPTKVTYLPNGDVKILDGILQNFIAQPVKFDKHKRRATLSITMCGQAREITLSIIPVNQEEA